MCRLIHATLGACLAGLLAWYLASISGCEKLFLCGGSARLAGLLSGSPVCELENGWRIAFQRPVIVTTACSGATFFIMVASLAGWHLGWKKRRPIVAAAIAAAVLPVVLFINAVRVLAVAQMHQWVIPRFPETYAPMLHMVTGVAVFLPAFIAINLLLEKYGFLPKHTDANQPSAGT